MQALQCRGEACQTLASLCACQSGLEPLDGRTGVATQEYEVREAAFRFEVFDLVAAGAKRCECTLQEFLRFVEPPHVREDPSEQAGGLCCVGCGSVVAPDRHRLADDRLGLVVPTLVGERLADVVADCGGGPAVADGVRRIPGLICERQTVVPPAAEVRAHCQVVEHRSDSLLVPRLSVDVERSLPVYRLLVSAESNVRPVEDVVGSSFGLLRLAGAVLGLGDRLPRPLDRIDRAALNLAYCCVRRHQSCAFDTRLLGVQAFERRDATGQPAKRLGGFAEPYRHPVALFGKAGVLNGVALDVLFRCAERLTCLLVPAEEHADVAQCRRCPRELLGWSIGDQLRGVQRLLEKLRRFDVRVLLCSPAARFYRVVPRLGPPLRTVEVEREDLGNVFGPCALRSLYDLGDAGVEFAAPFVREPFVRGVADESVTEPERAGTCGSRSTYSPSRSQASDAAPTSASSSKTSAMSDPENDTPRTEAQRRSARSPGPSWSMRVATSASTVSGSCSASSLFSPTLASR